MKTSDAFCSGRIRATVDALGDQWLGTIQSTREVRFRRCRSCVTASPAMPAIQSKSDEGSGTTVLSVSNKLSNEPLARVYRPRFRGFGWSSLFNTPRIRQIVANWASRLTTQDSIAQITGAKSFTSNRVSDSRRGRSRSRLKNFLIIPDQPIESRPVRLPCARSAH